MQSRGIPPALIGSMVALILAGTSAGTAYAKTTMPSPPDPHAKQPNLTLRQVTVTGTLIQGVAPVGTAVNTLTPLNPVFGNGTLLNALDIVGSVASRF